MTSTLLDTEINKYLPLLGTEEKMSLLTVIKSFLNLKKENPDNINIEEYNKEIDEAMARIDNGKFTNHEDVEKEMESW
jgi:predicted transcriptional regulator